LNLESITGIPIYEDKTIYEQFNITKYQDEFKYFENVEKDKDIINRVIFTKSNNLEVILNKLNSDNVTMLNLDDNIFPEKEQRKETMKEYIDRIRRGEIIDEKIVNLNIVNSK